MIKTVGKCLGVTTVVIAALTIALGAFLFYVYRVVDSGTLFLEKAPGTAAITREGDTGIAHIRGDSYLSVVYAQGFAHA